MSNDISELERLRVQLEPLVGTNQDGTKIHPYLIDNRLDAATSLIDAVIAKREQEAERRGRIDELQKYLDHYKDDYDRYADERIAELKAQQEEV